MSRLVGAALLVLCTLGQAQAQSPNAQPADSAAQPPNSAAAENAARPPSELLAKMAEQRRQLNYQGTFTHQDIIGTESFRLQHWVQDGTEYQRLYYLQGPEREAIISKALDCRVMGDQLIANRVDQLAEQYDKLEQFYSFRPMGLDRIAGRTATVLHIAPRDPFRFGYLFSVDRETGLVLKSVLLDENQRPVEQFQFIELATGIPAERFSPEKGAQVSHRVAAEEVADCASLRSQRPDNWQLQWVPEGFAYSGQRQVNEDMQMLMYTDGLSTFSVFIDPVATDVAIEARAQRGATNFYLGGIEHRGTLYQLTVVGEVPASVAERVGQSIRAKTAAKPSGESG